MPIYEYKCKKCGNLNEFLVGISETDPSLNCEGCGSSRLEKMMSQVFFRSAAGSAGHEHASAPAGGSKCGGCSGGHCGSCH